MSIEQSLIALIVAGFAALVWDAFTIAKLRRLMREVQDIVDRAAP